MIGRKMLPTQIPMSWDEFTKWAPPFSIAIDGFVSGAPRFNARGPQRNLNHHEEVGALETRATCAQALILVRQGLLDEVFVKNGNPEATIFENDCDEDVCLTDFIFSHAPLVRSSMNPLLNRLVHMEDMLDTTAGAYAFPTDLDSLKKIMWIFEPYHRFRASGMLDRREADAFTGVVVDVGYRIMAHITGGGGSIELDPRYEVVGGGKGWEMIETIGLHGAMGAFADGHKAFVTVRTRPDGKFVYSMRRSADFVSSLPIPEVIEHLNALEGCKADRWGGRTTAVGSPRVGGSQIDPKALTQEIEDLKATLRL